MKYARVLVVEAGYPVKGGEMKEARFTERQAKKQLLADTGAAPAVSMLWDWRNHCFTLPLKFIFIKLLTKDYG